MAASAKHVPSVRWSAGELAPALHAGAPDQVKYLTGLRTCRNFIVQRAGGVTNRPGTRFVARCMTDDIDVILMRYVSENVGESVLLELNQTDACVFLRETARLLQGPTH